MKPDWHKGDVIAIPQDLAPFGNITRGCCVFVAEHEPRETKSGSWLYGLRDCAELRRATVEDVERLIEISVADATRELKELQRLMDIHTQMREATR